MDSVDILRCVARSSGFNRHVLISDIVTQIEEQASDVSCNISEIITLLRTLQQIIDITLSAGATDLAENKTAEVLQKVQHVCVHMLKLIKPSVDSRHESFVLLSQVCTLLHTCVVNGNFDLVIDLADMTQKSLHCKAAEETNDIQADKIIDVFCALECVKTLLSAPIQTPENHKRHDTLKDIIDDVFHHLLLIVSNFENKNIIHFVVKGLLQFVKSTNLNFEARLETCWNSIQLLWEKDNASSKASMLLCSMANSYLAVGGAGGLDVRTRATFWNIVQHGMSSKDTLARKQCMYLLKRAIDCCQRDRIHIYGNESVFSWNEKSMVQLTKVWEDFLMLMETLEEKQVHVIKPILPRMQKLIKATELEEGPLLHSSWLIVIVKRALIHESLFMVKWAVDAFLSLDMRCCPLLQQNQNQFICTDFLLSIQDAKLYNRLPDSAPSSCPPCAEALVVFFRNCWQALQTTEKRASFFGEILETLRSNHWGPAPLLYVCRAMAHVPPSPLLETSGVYCLRKTMTTNLQTVYSYLRGAVQSFCADILINLTNTETVSPQEISSFLTVFSCEESLQRGTTMWSKLVNWLKATSENCASQWSVEQTNMLITQQVDVFLQQSGDGPFLWSSFATCQSARFSLMAADAGLLPVTTEASMVSLYSVVNKTVEILNAINSHPYMSPLQAERALEMLLNFVQELGKPSVETDESEVCVLQGLENCAVQLVLFVNNRLLQGWKQVSCVHSIKLCEKALLLVLSKCQHNELMVQTLNLMKYCLKVLLQPRISEQNCESQMECFGAMCLIGSVASFFLTKDVSELTSDQQQVARCLLDSDLMNFELSFKKTSTVHSQKEWGKIASTFLSHRCQLLLLQIVNRKQMSADYADLLDMCLDNFDLIGGKSVLSIFTCIQNIVPLVIKEVEASKLVSVIEQGWNQVLEQKTGTWFLSVFSAYVKMVYQPALLKLPVESPVMDKLMQSCDVILTLGEEKNAISVMLVSHLCKICCLEEMRSHIHKFYPVLVSACLYGPVHKRQDRQQIEMDAYLETLGTECSVNEVTSSFPKDSEVRVSVLNLLCKLNPTSPLDVSLVQGLIDRLILQYWQLNKISKGATFPNSLVHRQKQRMMQTLVLVEPFISGVFVEDVWRFCIESIGQEKLPSVRHTIEWLMLRLLIHHDFLINLMWDAIINTCETKTMIICSLLCVISHLGLHLKGKTQKEYYSKAVPLMIPWCMAHHFNTKLHAQATMTKLWAQCHHLQLTEILSGHVIVQAMLDHCNRTKNNSSKNVGKLLDNFFMKSFDPESDYSVETIFLTFPRLAGLIDDEWIPPRMFSKLDAQWLQSPERMLLPLHNKTTLLRDISPGTWKIKTLNPASEDDDDDAQDRDVQKKIMPWRLMIPDDETQEELDYSKKKHQTGGLVLVTSLIDKLPNLGGLCRTSEIFGVSEFVIGKMKYLEDKVFQTLSVTAHKWLPITEVYHTKLSEYLTEKKKDGYTLVGVEQTANSVDLTDFQFPQKSLLLLGNEKEGIPVELINMLDVCVEIPQQGIIRSLNVHVSGALLVWEYRRQQINRLVT